MQMINGAFVARREISPNLEKALQQIHNGTVKIVNNVPSTSSIVTSSDVTPLTSFQTKNDSNAISVDDNFHGLENTGQNLLQNFAQLNNFDDDPANIYKHDVTHGGTRPLGKSENLTYQSTGQSSEGSDSSIGLNNKVVVGIILGLGVLAVLYFIKK